MPNIWNYKINSHCCIAYLQNTFKVETLYWLNNNFLCFPTSSNLRPSHHYFTVCLNEFNYFRGLTQWKHTVCVLLWLAYFTEHSVFNVHACCRLCQEFPHLWDWILSCCLYIHIFLIHLFTDGPFGGSHLLALMGKCYCATQHLLSYFSWPSTWRLKTLCFNLSVLVASSIAFIIREKAY